MNKQLYSIDSSKLAILHIQQRMQRRMEPKINVFNWTQYFQH